VLTSAGLLFAVVASCNLGHCLQVTIKTSASKASAAKPFETAYGRIPTNNPKENALWGSTLVLSVPFMTNTWAIVVNPKGPAEW
jgi:hypothetical protein